MPVLRRRSEISRVVKGSSIAHVALRIQSGAGSPARLLDQRYHFPACILRRDFPRRFSPRSSSRGPRGPGRSAMRASIPPLAIIDLAQNTGRWRTERLGHTDGQLKMRLRRAERRPKRTTGVHIRLGSMPSVSLALATTQVRLAVVLVNIRSDSRIVSISTQRHNPEAGAFQPRTGSRSCRSEFEF